MDKNAIINDIISELKKSGTFDQIIDKVIKERGKDKDKFILEQFKSCSFADTYGFMESNASLSDRVIGASVNGFLYNEFTGSFKIYPFKIVNDINGNTVVLVGIKNLGDSTWEECKDRKFKFVMFDANINDWKVFTGHIPTKEEIKSIPENLRAIGNWYWTSTRYSPNISNAWIVDGNGGIYDSNVNSSFGVVPYIVIVIDNIVKGEK